MVKFLRQMFVFFGISGIGWLIDFGLFNLGYFLIKNEFLANIISSLAAVTFVFAISTQKIFKTKTLRYGLKCKYMIYILYQFFLIIMASFAVRYISVWLKGNMQDFLNYAHIVAKILVTPGTMVLNFLVMKVLTERI